MKKLFSAIRNFILDTLFPISCLSCGRADVWFCQDCLEHAPLRREQCCPICEKVITPNGHTCPSCREKDSIDGLLAASFYFNKSDKNQDRTRNYQFVPSREKCEIISKMIHLYKYRFIKDLSAPLGKLLSMAALDSELPIPDLIIPVPLHKKRLRWRGFNQAELLARYLGENLMPGFPIPILDDFLIRRKNTTAQMQIKNYSQRQKNMEGAFEINAKNKSLIASKNIWLLDDVATTGSTLFECAKVLKNAGATSVFGLVIARQEFKKK